MKKCAMFVAVNVLSLTLAIAQSNYGPTLTDDRNRILQKGSSVLNKIEQLELNNENLITVLKFYNVKFAGVVYQQALLETGNFTSYLCRNNNNLFGMYNPAPGRKTTSIGACKYGYAIYSHWTKSVEDYKHWQDMFEVNTNDYYEYLGQRGYAEATVYVDNLKRIQIPVELKSNQKL